MSLQRARERSTTCWISWFNFTGASVSCGFALAVKLPHARHGMRHVFDGVLDGVQIIAGARAEVRLVFQQGFGVKRDGRNGVVDVVGDAAGHLAEGAEAFLLHDGLLRLAQIVVGLLQGARRVAPDARPAPHVRSTAAEIRIRRC